MSTKNRITDAAAHMATPGSRLRTAFVDAPAFSSRNPLLADTADDAPNQLPKHLRGTDLTIDVPAFDQGEDGKRGIITLYWNEVAVGTPFSFTTPIPDFPVELTLPASETMVQGHFFLSYTVNLVGNITPSLLLEVNIDTTAPNNNQPGARVTLPPEVEANGITKEYLDANGGKVVVSVRGDYADAKINDVVTLWFGPSIPLAKKVGSFTRADLVVPVTIELLEADLTFEGDGALFYTLTDRKGNEGPDSECKTVLVRLTPAP
ncbi:hypothetical protein HG549_07315 [Pseudomonas sp. SK]|uniref:hypothetical protein n=1 Tax=Pseudomonas sp. SK TaxID=2729423 RepID=UPI00146395C6|nr:hypothetical protein [Pseudomonas sp. SK]QJQ19762.1 hypothetical protein HG549_07315 [Pseudomonas sp. SK]